MPNKKIGLALGSGGPRGIAHVGVIKWLLENSINPEIIAGTSIGAVIGSFFAAGYKIENIENEVLSISKKLIFKYIKPSLRRGAMINPKGVKTYFEKYFSNVNIEDLALPFAAVATNQETGDAVRFTKGSVTDAIMASSAALFAFPPYIINGERYVDGVLSEPVPAKTAKQIGAEKIIAIDVRPGNESKNNKPPKSVTGIFLKSYNISVNNLIKAQLSMEPDSLLLRPEIPSNFLKAENSSRLLIDCGYSIMEENKNKILSFL
ncbi:MAG: patatin-like phospholipase family protein [Spirochaetales bacterium]|nr:patatin-like phospholipase family protein [Spirochaetales bacterium]